MAFIKQDDTSNKHGVKLLIVKPLEQALPDCNVLFWKN